MTTKYDRDNPDGFQEPILRCVECQKMIFVEDLRKQRVCVCGCPRFRPVSAIDSDELKILRKRRVDPEFLRLFDIKPTFLDRVRAYVGI